MSVSSHDDGNTAAAVILFPGACRNSGPAAIAEMLQNEEGWNEMTIQKPASKSFEQVRAQQLEYNAKREKGYRERALKIYPWICGRCAREFERKNLSELTVHHVDHNHDNNPSDGSNWELLCIYCHDEEHSKFENLVRYGSTTDTKPKPATYNPFADLKAKMEGKD